MPRHARATTVHPVAIRHLEVLRVTDVTPALRRVTLTGDQLGPFTSTEDFERPGFVSTGFDDDIKLVFPYPGETETVLPTLRADGGLTYPKDPRPLARSYTVRRYDAESRELDIDFVKHGVGVATTWAYRAKPGDRVHVAGPTVSLGLPDDADWLLVVGDDTAIPAIARLLEDLPDDARAQVFIEMDDHGHRLELRKPGGVEVTWLPRRGTESGLVDAVSETAAWDGNCHAWIAGEQSVVRDVRRYLVEERGLPKTQINFSGYWRRGEVVALENDPQVPDPERNEEAWEKFHELAEVAPAQAIRVASNLGIGDLISRGTTTVDGLAERTQTDPRALGKFLRYLHSLELLTATDDGYALTETGEFLALNWVADHLAKDGVASRRERGFYGLDETLRKGIAAYASEYAALREQPWFANKVYDDAAEFANFYAAPTAAARTMSDVSHIVIHSDSAGSVAAAIVGRHPQTRVTIAALPTFAEWLRTDLPTTIPDAGQRSRVDVVEQSIYETSPSADRVLIATKLCEHPDAEAMMILRKAAASLSPGGRVLVAEDTFDVTGLDEHEAEDDLLNLALYGSGRRTADELDKLIADARMRIVATEPLAFGRVLRVAGA